MATTTATLTLSSADLTSDALSLSTSTTFTKAYLRHLLKTNEMLGMRLATIQNLGFYLRLMNEYWYRVSPREW